MYRKGKLLGLFDPGRPDTLDSYHRGSVLMAESGLTGKALAWDIRTTARKLNVHERTVRRMLDSHELPCIRVRGAIRIPVKAVEQYWNPRSCRGIITLARDWLCKEQAHVI